MEGLILSPVLLAPKPNAQGGTTGSKDPFAKAARLLLQSVPVRKASSQKVPCLIPSGFLGLLIIPFNCLIYVMLLIIHNYNCYMNNVIAGT